MQLGDIRTAIKMRETITQIAQSVVDIKRPEDKIGTVFSFNPTTQTAQILFAGESNESLVEAHFAKNMRPMRQMADNFASQGYSAAGDIVRVSGKPGSYWISDYISGGPGYWIAYSPTATGTTQFISSYTSTGKYTIIGDVCFFDFRVAIITAGAAVNEPLAVYLPVQAAPALEQAVAVGRENQLSGLQCQGVINSNAVQIICFTYANAGLVQSSNTVIFSGHYQVKV